LPHLVQMHKKHASDGLIALAVSIDTLKVEDGEKLMPRQKVDATVQKVQEVIRKQGMKFPTVILDDRGEVDDFAYKKLRFEGPPCVFIFDREGKWTQIVGAEEKDLAKIDKLVDELLKKK
jgi:hypothetical protein